MRLTCEVPERFSIEKAMFAPCVALPRIETAHNSAFVPGPRVAQQRIDVGHNTLVISPRQSRVLTTLWLQVHAPCHHQWRLLITLSLHLRALSNQRSRVIATLTLYFHALSNHQLRVLTTLSLHLHALSNHRCRGLKTLSFASPCPATNREDSQHPRCRSSPKATTQCHREPQSL